MCACVHVRMYVSCSYVVHVCTKLGPLGMRYSSSVMPDPSSIPSCVGVHVSTKHEHKAREQQMDIVWVFEKRIENAGLRCNTISFVKRRA